MTVFEWVTVIELAFIIIMLARISNLLQLAERRYWLSKSYLGEGAIGRAS